MLRAGGMVLLLLVSIVACKSEVKKEQDEQALLLKAEQRLKEQQALEEERTKRRILENPNAYLEASGLEAFNKGIINSYRQLTKMSVTNKTKYPLEGMAGEAACLDDGGTMHEIITFRLKGSVAPGDTKIFAASNGTLESSTTESHAHKYRVNFQQVRFVDNPE